MVPAMSAVTKQAKVADKGTAISRRKVQVRAGSVASE